MKEAWIQAMKNPEFCDQFVSSQLWEAAGWAVLTMLLIMLLTVVAYKLIKADYFEVALVPSLVVFVLSFMCVEKIGCVIKCYVCPQVILLEKTEALLKGEK